MTLPEEGMRCKKSERAISDAHRRLLKSKKKKKNLKSNKKNHKNQSANKIKNNGECHEWDIWHFHTRHVVFQVEAIAITRAAKRCYRIERYKEQSVCTKRKDR